MGVKKIKENLEMRSSNVYPQRREGPYRQNIYAKGDGSYFIYTPHQIHSGPVYVLHLHGPNLTGPPKR